MLILQYESNLASSGDIVCMPRCIVDAVINVCVSVVRPCIAEKAGVWWALTVDVSMVVYFLQYRTSSTTTPSAKRTATRSDDQRLNRPQ